MSRYKVYLLTPDGKRTDICWTDKAKTARDLNEVILRVLVATGAAGEPKVEKDEGDVPWIDEEAVE